MWKGRDYLLGFINSFIEERISPIHSTIVSPVFIMFQALQIELWMTDMVTEFTI